MPWVPKAEAAATEEAEKPAKEKKGKGEKGSSKGKGKGEKGKEREAQVEERFEPKGGKKGKGKGKEEEKGKGKGKSKEASPAPKGSWGKGKRGDDEDARPPRQFERSGGKSDSWKGGRREEEGGKSGSKGGKKGKGRPSDDNHDRPEKPNRSEDAKRQATALSGKHCQVKKHSSMGCAIITLNDETFRKALIDSGMKIELGGHDLKLKPHFDKETNQEFLCDVFVGWGRQAEKANALPEQDLADFFDQKYEEYISSGGAQAQMRARAQQTAAMQAKWAAAGAQPSGARPPATASLASMPGAMPTAVPGAPPPPYSAVPGVQAPAQQAQQQQMAAMQAQMLQRYQQQQQAAYAHYIQAQQQQQAWMQHMQAQKEAEAQAMKKRQAGYKASFRVPTDEEVKAKFAQLGSPPKEAGATAPGGESTEAPVSTELFPGTGAPATPAAATAEI